MVAVVSLLAASTLQPLWLGLSERTPWAQLVQLRVAAAGAALATATVLAVLALLLRLARRRPSRTPVLALVLALVAAGHGSVLVARGALSGQDDPVARPGDLTVLTLNMGQDGASTADVADLARRRGADALMLSELSPDRGREIGEDLGAGGRPWTVLCAPTDVPAATPPNRYSLLPFVTPAVCLVLSPSMGPYEVAGPQPDLLGGALVAQPLTADDGGPGSAGAVGPQAPPRPPLAVVHTTPPIPLSFGMERWRREVAAAVALCPSLDGGVVAGDLNTSQDAAGLHRSAPCVDTAAGAPAAGTWPSSLPGGLGARIDHVLADGRAWTPVGTRTAVVAGTDHRAVVSVVRPR